MPDTATLDAPPPALGARQIAEQADEEGYPLCEKPVTTAINEVAAGKLTAENIDTHIAK